MHIKLQNGGVYIISPCLYIKIIPFLVEKIAEAGFVVIVVVETYPSFAVALRPIAVVVAAAALAVVRAL